MTETLRPILAELRRRFERHYGPRLARMILYGSQARSDADTGSDIDVLVVLDGEVRATEEIKRTIDDVAGLSLDHDVVIACVFISAERFERERSPLLLNVRREGLAV